MISGEIDGDIAIGPTVEMFANGVVLGSTSSD